MVKIKWYSGLQLLLILMIAAYEVHVSTLCINSLVWTPRPGTKPLVYIGVVGLLGKPKQGLLGLTLVFKRGIIDRGKSRGLSLFLQEG